MLKRKRARFSARGPSLWRETAHCKCKIGRIVLIQGEARFLCHFARKWSRSWKASFCSKTTQGSLRLHLRKKFEERQREWGIARQSNFQEVEISWHFKNVGQPFLGHEFELGHFCRSPPMMQRLLLGQWSLRGSFFCSIDKDNCDGESTKWLGFDLSSRQK